MVNYNQGRCNFSGHETGGPKHMLGGVYPASYEGRQKWLCENQATHRVRMHCTLYGHSGPVMAICDAHHAEIQKRMAGLCTRCAFPPAARELEEEIQSAQALLQEYYYAEKRHWDDPKLVAQRHRIEAARVRMDELTQSGTIKKVPMVLVEVA